MFILSWFKYWQVRAIIGVLAFGLFLPFYLGVLGCQDDDCIWSNRNHLMPIILGPVLVIAFVVLPYTSLWEEHVAPRLKHSKEKWPDGPEE
jgi:hypothetical protein